MVKITTADRFGSPIVIFLCCDEMLISNLLLLSANVLVMGTSILYNGSIHHGWEEGRIVEDRRQMVTASLVCSCGGLRL